MRPFAPPDSWFASIPALALALAALAACGSGGSSSAADARAATADAAAPLTQSELNAREAHARCARLYGCCTPTELTGTGFANEADCVGQVGGGLSDLRPVFDEHIAAGTVAYRPELAGACIARLEALTCDEVAAQRFTIAVPFDVYCIEAYQGLIADGRACSADLDCTSRNCIAAPLTGAGTCGQPPGLGQPCTSHCTDDLECVGSTSTAAGTCAVKSGVGGACATTPDCQAGLVCVQPAGTCQVDATPVCDGL